MVKCTTFYLSQSHPDFDIALKQLSQAKDFSNLILFVTRQSFFMHSKDAYVPDVKALSELGISLDELKSLRYDANSLSRLATRLGDRSDLPAKLCQTVARSIAHTWSSFFGLLKSYRKGVVANVPRLRRYYGINSYPVLNFNKQCLKGMRKFPSVNRLIPMGWSTGFKVPKEYRDMQAAKLRYISPFKLELILVYNDNGNPDECNLDYDRYAGIDLGVSNFVTMAFSFNRPGIIVKGNRFKYVNAKFNRITSNLKSSYTKEVNCYLKRNNIDYSPKAFHETASLLGVTQTRKLSSIQFRRNMEIKNLYQRVSNIIIHELCKANVGNLIIGYSEYWKSEVNLGRVNNYRFVSIPYKEFVDDLSVKARSKGIKVFLTEESYTSKSSFLDDVLPVYSRTNPYTGGFNGKRVQRGLYKSNQHGVLNADLNGAYNIIRKVVRGFSVNSFIGCVATQCRSLKIY